MRFLPQPDVQIAAVRGAGGDADFCVVARAGWNANVDRLFGVAQANGQLARRSVMHVFQRKREFGFNFPGPGSPAARTRPSSELCIFRTARSPEQRFEEI